MQACLTRVPFTTMADTKRDFEPMFSIFLVERGLSGWFSKGYLSLFFSYSFYVFRGIGHRFSFLHKRKISQFPLRNLVVFSMKRA